MIKAVSSVMAVIELETRTILVKKSKTPIVSNGKTLHTLRYTKSVRDYDSNTIVLYNEFYIEDSIESLEDGTLIPQTKFTAKAEPKKIYLTLDKNLEVHDFFRGELMDNGTIPYPTITSSSLREWLTITQEYQPKTTSQSNSNNPFE